MWQAASPRRLALGLAGGAVRERVSERVTTTPEASSRPVG